MPTGYSGGVVDLLSMMLVSNPTKRPSAGDVLKHPLFLTAKRPTPIKPRQSKKEVSRSSDEVSSVDMDMLRSMMSDTSSVMSTELKDMVKAYEADAGDELHPAMALVTRVMDNMGQTSRAIQERKSHLERQVEMLKSYCLQVLDNDQALFSRACKTLDKSQDEEEIEEHLIRVLGHEKYGLCGVQLLYYKKFTYVLRNK